MGMSIDEAINHLGNYSSTNGSGLTTDKQHNEAKRVAIDIMRKYQQLQADYETRLKADMVAMLEDLRLAIEELDYPKDCDYACNGCLYWGDVDKLIDEKINALRGENETC